MTSQKSCSLVQGVGCVCVGGWIGRRVLAKLCCHRQASARETEVGHGWQDEMAGPRARREQGFQVLCLQRQGGAFVSSLSGWPNSHKPVP